MNIFLPRNQERVLLELYGQEGLEQIVSKLLKVISQNEQLAEALVHVDRFARYNHADQRTIEGQSKLTRRLEKKLEYEREIVGQRQRQIQNQKEQIIDLKAQLETVEWELGRVRGQLEIAASRPEPAAEAPELNPPALPPAAAPEVVERVVEKVVEVEVPGPERLITKPIDPKVFADAVEWAAVERLRMAVDDRVLMSAVRKIAAQEFLLQGNRSRFVELLFGIPEKIQHEIVSKICVEAIGSVKGETV
ncbi:hypothetical protein [Ruegeria sp. HKCCC2117]|uniref:hypothetical protein n=1 Tax=Ruegeria sp. HKCCC2117 TaxID=2682992 RepID=UPI001487B640|nr:hypothetical protein [Ruegeria sp. HKCCC2117]